MWKCIFHLSKSRLYGFKDLSTRARSKLNNQLELGIIIELTVDLNTKAKMYVGFVLLSDPSGFGFEIVAVKRSLEV